MNFFKKLFITGLFTGYSPLMSGTCGTFIGVGVYLLLYKYVYILAPLIILLFILGVRLSDCGENHFNEKDSKKIVIDEIVGYLIAVINIKNNYSLVDKEFWVIVAIGFVLFRFFDIVKPLYINKLQNIKGGLGVMIDDLLAGVYTNLCLLLIIPLILTK